MFIPLIRFRDGPLLKHAHPPDAGHDVFIQEDVIIPSRTTLKLPLGFGVKLPVGTMAFLMGRSSVSSRGLLVHQCPIDSGYTGEIAAIVTNVSPNAITLVKGIAVAQIVFQEILTPVFEGGALFTGNVGARGTGAFGSTDTASGIKAQLEAFMQNKIEYKDMFTYSER
jgi:dUTP pyrophosphatase